MSSAPADRLCLAFVGGTGPEGRGLALRFARLGHPVVVGSRSIERATACAAEISAAYPDVSIQGVLNRDAAAQGDIVVLTIPYAGLEATLPELAEPTREKIVITAIAPVEFRVGRPVALRPLRGSAAQEVQAALPQARLVSAFQTVDAHTLLDVPSSLDTDVVVCSDDAEARHTVMGLARELPGVRTVSGGRLAASQYVEEIVVLLITLNRIYKAHTGIRITGIHRD